MNNKLLDLKAEFEKRKAENDAAWREREMANDKWLRANARMCVAETAVRDEQVRQQLLAEILAEQAK